MQETLFTMAKLEDFVPSDHPLRPIQGLVNTALTGLNDLFNQMYAGSGRASVAPEKLMGALLLQVFYSIRSERQLMEQIRYNLLFRWFVGLAIDDAVSDHSVFSKNRDRLIEHEAVEKFFTEVMALADKKGLLSKEHFSVDGTLVQAWASQKSFRPKDGGDDGPGTPGRDVDADWKGRPRSNQTHASTTDPDSRLFRKTKGTPATLCYQGHALMENRSGSSSIDGRTARHAGYQTSQRIRKRIEEHFGWAKTIGRIRQTVFRGIGRVDLQFKLNMLASNIVRMARMPGAAPGFALPEAR